MAIADSHHHQSNKKWRLCPFWQSATASSSSSSTNNLYNQSQNHSYQNGGVASSTRSSTVSSVARSLLPARRKLRLDPSNNLYFPYEPGKQVRSAVRIKNSSKSHVAFKFQTTAPKSCYMRPPGGILVPGEELIATVFKFVEQPENNEKPINQKSKFDEQRDQVTVERMLRVVFLDPDRANPALEKLKRQLAEADAALEARKKPPAETGPRVVGEGLVIDEWKERREKYLARQQVEAVDSV
ncbi:UNVERIFIED_CONTAM: Vesicle-associated protein 4-1 [Sesamum angustifolium]|uniref:Vesicle-associated protein 4-1 n=1 Tax=Sesamum angustifolium TaxID=2727405 RepID=A0AAW2PF12_9LAMI